MSVRIFIPLSLLLFLLAAALSTGSPLLLLFSTLLFVLILTGLLSVLIVSATLNLSVSSDRDRVMRGEKVNLNILLRHRGLFPVAPIQLTLESAPGAPLKTIRLRDLPGKQQSLSLPFRADHVGTSSPGIRSCTVEDLMGFFRKTVVPGTASASLLVLPNHFDTEPLTLSPGDPGSELMSRATEDLSLPSDIRSWQPGDPMKKIHWKLSLRKRELMVRKYDEPILQEVLLLMDCSRPPSWGHPEAEADIRDALLETAASVFQDQEVSDLDVHFPLQGKHPIELEKSMGLPLVLENIARTDFSETDRFERVLTLESRRLRKVGCVVVISARLNSTIVDVLVRLRTFGPNIRLYFVTFAPEDAEILALVGRLQQTGIQVSYVIPQPVQ